MSERGTAHTERSQGDEALCPLGVVTCLRPNLKRGQGVKKFLSSQMHLERTTIEGDSPVGESEKTLEILLSTTGHEKSCGNLGRPLSKAKYFWRPIVNQYCEGKVKSTPGGE